MTPARIIIFKVGNEEYGLPLERVVSIEALKDSKKLAILPPYIKGVIEVRAEYIPLIDIQQFFYGKETLTVENKTKVIIVETEDIKIAYIVDEAEEIVDIKDQLKLIPVLPVYSTMFYEGVASLNGCLIPIINPNQLLLSISDLPSIKEMISSIR